MSMIEPKNCEYTNVIVHIIKADKMFYF